MASIHYIWWGNPTTDQHRNSAQNTPNIMASKVSDQHTVRYWRQRGAFNAVLDPAIVQEQIGSPSDILSGTTMSAGRGIRIDRIVDTLTKYRAFAAVKDLVSLLVLYKHGGYYFDTTTAIGEGYREHLKRLLADRAEPSVVRTATGQGIWFVPDDDSPAATWGLGMQQPTSILLSNIDVWAMYAPARHESVATMIDSYIERASQLGLDSHPDNKVVPAIAQYFGNASIDAMMTQDQYRQPVRNSLIGKLIINSVLRGLHTYARKRGRQDITDYAWETKLIAKAGHDPALFQGMEHAVANAPAIGIQKQHAGAWR